MHTGVVTAVGQLDQNVSRSQKCPGPEQNSSSTINDLSNVFDYIPHDRMVQKVTAYCMTHEAVKLLISYVRLGNRW